MTIFDDAEQGKLDKYKLEQYIKDGVAIDGVDPSTNLTALGLAIKNDRVNATKLLIDNGAKPDVPLNPDGRTPIYLAASAKGNRPRLVQTLLPLTPQTFDQPIPSFENETPLFPAVRLRDANTVRLLVEDGASLDKKNAKGQTVQEIADLLNDQAVKDALKAVPKKRRGGMRTLFDSFALKVLAWFGIWKPFQKIWGAAADTFYGIASPTGVRPGKVRKLSENQNVLLVADCNPCHRTFPSRRPPLTLNKIWTTLWTEMALKDSSPLATHMSKRSRKKLLRSRTAQKTSSIHLSRSNGWRLWLYTSLFCIVVSLVSIVWYHEHDADGMK